MWKILARFCRFFAAILLYFKLLCKEIKMFLLDKQNCVKINEFKNFKIDLFRFGIVMNCYLLERKR